MDGLGTDLAWLWLGYYDNINNNNIIIKSSQMYMFAIINIDLGL